MRLKPTLAVLIVLFLGGCKDDVLPKPKAQLRLEYPKATQGILETDNFSFQYNNEANIIDNQGSKLTLDYPEMKGSIFITFKKVDNNLENLLIDARKLSYDHAVVADGIAPSEFINHDTKVYGAFYEVIGNAASQAQFYVTDSTEHFLTGSLYFYTKPNYDSIYPAAAYLQEDIKRIMETLQWK